MKLKTRLYFAITALTLLSVSCGTEAVEIYDLRCEYLDSPIGIDASQPRLTWKITGSASDRISFRVAVGEDSISMAESGKGAYEYFLNSPGIFLVRHAPGRPVPHTRYFWRVEQLAGNGKMISASPVASFETGMLDASNWKAGWIYDGKSIEYKPAPFFRKEFSIDGEVKAARAYIAAAGLFELSVNGKKVGDSHLDPMYTAFDKRILYVTHDITSYLCQGGNAAGLVLGNGWYNHQSTAVWFFDKASWRGRPRVMAELHIEYTDGRRDIVVTDTSWKSTDSPVIFNSIYTAEHYDARKELPGWDSSGYGDSTWENALAAVAPTQNIVSQQMCPVRITDTLTPIKTVKVNERLYRFHFARNIAGIADLRIKGKRGTQLRIKHSEKINPDGSLNMANIDYHFRPTDDSDPFQTDIMILSGGEDHFRPRFNYKGFQYIEIMADGPIEISEGDLIALELHSDVPDIGRIDSSNETINSIHRAGRSSYLANLFGYPTDCPQREKNGWTGDGHFAIETGLYNFDGITVYEKWLRDFQDAQRPDGVLPGIIPTSVWGYDWGNGIDWTCAVAVIPWQIYRFYGDNSLLLEMYGTIKKLVDYVTSISPEGTTDWGLGDWIPYKAVSNPELTSSVFYYVTADILAKAAGMKGHDDECRQYGMLAEKIKGAINDKFLDRGKGIYCDGTQTELSVPLFWGVVPDDIRPLVAENLHKRVEADGFHLDVGVHGARALLCALSENGYAQTAYRVASQETFPSWGYWIVNGATTFYENWRIDVDKDASYNHIMYGEICAWFYKGLGGIYPGTPGFRHIEFRPNFVNGLDRFSADHVSPFGKISSEWRRDGSEVTCRLNVPPGSTATFHYPPEAVRYGQRVELASGGHTITVKLK